MLLEGHWVCGLRVTARSAWIWSTKGLGQGDACKKRLSRGTGMEIGRREQMQMSGRRRIGWSCWLWGRLGLEVLVHEYSSTVVQ